MHARDLGMHTLRLRVILAGWMLAGAIACAAHDDFHLIHPPAARDDQFPGGYRLLVKAPLGDWQGEAQFPSRAACDQARRAAAESAITRAHALVGDEAKNDLDVRRAVHARCVRSARLEKVPGS